MAETFISDNAGNRTPGHPNFADPVAASGITLSTGTAGDDKTQTLVAGQMYAITYVSTAGKRMLASITGVTSLAANIEWVFMANVTYVFRMPVDKTVLYFEADEDDSAYVRKLAEP